MPLAPLRALPLLSLLAVVAVPAPSRAQRAPESSRGGAAARQLRRTLDSLAKASGGALGVGIEVLETRRRVMRDADGHYPMQSVYKLPIAMATLAAVDAGRLKLDQDVAIVPGEYVRIGQYSPIRDKWPQGVTLPLREVLRLNTVESDGTACDVLLRVLGGADSVRAWLGSIGVRDVEVRDPEKTLGADWTAQYRNWMTPASALVLLRAAHEGRGLSAASHALLLDLMRGTTTGPRRLKAGLPAGTALAHRTGTGGARDGVTSATNDIGIVTLPDGRHLAIAVLLRDSRADDAAREATIAAVARAAWGAWGAWR